MMLGRGSAEEASERVSRSSSASCELSGSSELPLEKEEPEDFED